MSGEVIHLGGDAFIVRALRALDGLRTDLPDHALVGGLAVMVRLQQAHRVTADIDFVSSDEARTIELLVGGDATRTPNGVRLQVGVDLDLIDAAEPRVELVAVMNPEERHAIEKQTAFAHALLWATLVDISASAPDQTTASTSLRVATTADLVILKLHSAVDPRRASTKRGSDLYDCVRLLLTHGTGVVASVLGASEPILRIAVSERAREVLVDSADRSAATLRGSSVRGVEAIAADQLELLGNALIAAISRRAAD